VVVTGGNGFLGRRLLRSLLGRDDVEEVVLVDRVEGDPPGDARARTVVADLAAASEHLAEVTAALRDADSVFHLSSMVSAESELDWPAAVAVNVGGLVAVLEAAGAGGRRPRLVFASSVAVFGGTTGGDALKQLPLTTYGATKAIGELLVNDATRQGFVDGRSARLPTVIVRPGAPNRAASSFVSGIFREPLRGEPCVVPVAGATGVVVVGVDTAVAGLLALHDLPGDQLGHDRAVGIPGLSVTVDEMAAALERAGGAAATGLLRWDPDPAVAAIVATWPSTWDDSRARALGLPADDALDDVVAAYAAGTSYTSR
jgi:nucleoside-diphosphate-sugar epimerase